MWDIEELVFLIRTYFLAFFHIQINTGSIVFWKMITCREMFLSLYESRLAYLRSSSNIYKAYKPMSPFMSTTLTQWSFTSSTWLFTSKNSFVFKKSFHNYQMAFCLLNPLIFITLRLITLLLREKDFLQTCFSTTYINLLMLS